MKNIYILFLLLTCCSSCAQEKEQTHTEEIEQFQYELNVHYSDKKTSPLKPQDLKKFKSLSFFPTNESYRVEADFERTPDEPVFEMPTSGDKTPLYAQYGIAAIDRSTSDRVLPNPRSVVYNTVDYRVLARTNTRTNLG